MEDVIKSKASDVERGGLRRTLWTSSAVEAEALVPVRRVRRVCFELLVVFVGSYRDGVDVEVHVHEELELARTTTHVGRDHGDAIGVRADEAVVVEACVS